MKGGDEDLAKDFRNKAYKGASNLQRKRKQRLFSAFILPLYSCLMCGIHIIPVNGILHKSFKYIRLLRQIRNLKGGIR